MNNFGFVFKQAQKLQDDIAKAQSELAEMKVTGSAGGGMVEVIANCRQQILSIKIEPAIKESGDLEMLEDLVLAATNQALQLAQQQASEHMSKLGGGLLSMLPDGIKIPGINS
ncbi:YbaB/EbfC family nucleoid-associated protein [candidate division KSB1 bacterium]|nr:YbaB/EbfC family nucleoid-associated protein [candidate division KSB1 bacterium]